MDGKTRIITVATFAFLGVYSITCGTLYPKYEEAKTPKTSFLLVEQRQVGIKKEVSLKLKEITTEVNIPLSVKVTDYLEEAVTSDILAELKLDTSAVNVQQPGEYKYIIYYKKKAFEGKVIVKEKPLPEVKALTLTLRQISKKVGEAVSLDPSIYIVEYGQLSDEVKNNLRVDVSHVDPNNPGNYYYFIIYNGENLQGQYTVYQGQEGLAPPVTEQETGSGGNQGTPDPSGAGGTDPSTGGVPTE